MDTKYLHRLSRPMRARSDPHSESASALAVPLPDAAVAQSPSHEGARRRRRATACEVCGRTLLTGEQAVPVQHAGLTVDACPLCVIRLQTEARRSAA